MPYVWGCDLSLSNSGIAVFTEKGKPIQAFSIPTDPKENYGVRLKTIADSLLKWRKKYPPSHLVIENAFTRFNKSTQVLFRVRGLVEYLFWNVPQTFLSPRAVKKAVTGHGQADKIDVENAMFARYPRLEIDDHDCSDALAVGTAYFIEYRKES